MKASKRISEEKQKEFSFTKTRELIHEAIWDLYDPELIPKDKEDIMLELGQYPICNGLAEIISGYKPSKVCKTYHAHKFLKEALEKAKELIASKIPDARKRWEKRELLHKVEMILAVTICDSIEFIHGA